MVATVCCSISQHRNGASVPGSIILDRPGKLVQEVERAQSNLHLLDLDSIIQLLRACITEQSLPQGRLTHQLLIRRGFQHDDVAGNYLVQMYVKCGSYNEARTAFAGLTSRGLATWNSIISSASKHAHHTEVFELYSRMKLEPEECKQPNKLTFISVLSALSSPAATSLGRILHEDIRRRNLEQDLYVATALLNMYGRCGRLDMAHQVFERIHDKDLVSWNAMILACADNQSCDRALILIRRMWNLGLSPNRASFVAFLNCCSGPGYLQRGKQIHEKIGEMGLVSDFFLSTAIVTMYGKCGSVRDAVSVFEEMPERNVVSWNAMAAAFAQNGHHTKAFVVFNRMLLEGFPPNKITFVTLLKACCEPELLPLGQEVHAWVSKLGLESDVLVGTSLVTMYGNCGRAEDARLVFQRLPAKNVVTWNAMLTAYAEEGDWKRSFDLYQTMVRESFVPNKVTYLSVLNSFDRPAALEYGRVIHAKVVESGLMNSETCIGNATVSMYSKCGSVEEAMQVFDEMEVRDNVSWNGMVTVFNVNERPKEALAVFNRMQLEGFKPDKITLVGVLDVCASLGTVELGKSLHRQLSSASGVAADLVVKSAVLNMYGKCGCVKECEQLFYQEMEDKDLVAWNTMISAYAQHGHGRKALKLFRLMQQQADVKPDSSTFVSVLCGCSHAGLVEEGCHSFHLMQDFHIQPVEHYACLVDVLGRMGYVREAEEFILRHPAASKDPVVWTSLLGACNNYRSLESGERAAKRFIELEQDNSAGYVALANIYSAAGRWEDARQVRETMVRRGVKKRVPGKSSIVVKNKVHEFCVRDRSHPQSGEIYAELERLSERIKEEGYVPDTSSVLHDVEEEQKEQLVWYHSEKLAIAYGLVSIPGKSPVRIMKNLRVCRDCHTFTKLVSKVSEREIVVRDLTRFHHFKDGNCSCGDYW